MRDTIFISHATPEENAFTRWLGSKLELAGFKVWFDLDRLKGGDLFWPKIEAAIRHDTFRFLAVVSTVSVTKAGVQDEWALAATVEKSFPGFVIPIRIDGFDFSQLPITIHRKNVIDFHRGWHHGLASLTDTLDDAQAPRSAVSDPAVIRQWLPEHKDGAILRRESPESLDSTWLRVLSLPPSIETARILGPQRNIPVTQENRAIPWFQFEDRIVGFAKSADLVELMSKSAMLKEAGAVDTQSFIESGSTMGAQPIHWTDVRRRVVNLMRQAWELAMEAKGFGVHEQSGGRRVFYAPASLTGGQGKFVAFEDHDGRKRRKMLNGRSKARKANWAYAVGMVPSLDMPCRVELRATVVFFEESGEPIEAPLRAHRLRRGFCKNWWNEHWRTLQRAFLSLASAGEPEIHLPVGSGRAIVLSSSPIMFESAIGLSDAPILEDVEPHEEEGDELDERDAEDDAEAEAAA